MTITSMRVKPRKTISKDLSNPEVIRTIREEAERAVREEQTRRSLRRLRAAVTR